MKTNNWQLHRGATVRPDGSVHFSVWAPRVQHLAVECGTPRRTVPLQRQTDGSHTGTVPDLPLGSQYYYLLEGERRRPDPVSRYQPQGVHGPSAVIDPQAFTWTDHGWKGIALADLLFYELHPGTFTPQGTFAAIIPYLPYLRDELGITAIELMPSVEFAGARNWGYDGVHPYAPHSAYGGPQGLKTLVNACHTAGLAVALDVVYNHLGPEGNYLAEYGPYFTERYLTPWGSAVNFDGDESTEVRRYVLDNARYWVTEYHIDILRLDAIHGIFDASPRHIVQELGEVVQTQATALGRPVQVIAESDLNDAQIITPRSQGGWGLDAQWSDDFHHALHVVLTGERRGYYEDFGPLADLGTALREGFVYQGQYSAFRGRSHGTPSRHLPGERFVVFSQNHDQIGNRAYGERLSTLVPFPALKLAAGLVLCAPHIPLLFMGEEYGEQAPFLYFTSHTDPALGEAVSAGRRREFADAAWDAQVPDPQASETFFCCQLDHRLREREPHRALLRFYRDLIALRKRFPALHVCSTEHLTVEVLDAEQVLVIRRWQPRGEELLLLAACGREPVSCVQALPAGRWHKMLDSETPLDGGAGPGVLPTWLEAGEPRGWVLAPFAFAIYRRSDVG
jgi:maltooligosyltrehalose trehalohydrolase